jgi:hypothetical protein
MEVPSSTPLREAELGFKLSIGKTIIKADPDPQVELAGVDGVDHSAWATEYKTKKPGLIAVNPMDAVRAKVLADRFFDTYASFFQLRCASKSVKLKSITFQGPTGVPVQMDPPAATKYTWKLELSFYRWDGDTLTGQTDGHIVATHV